MVHFKAIFVLSGGWGDEHPHDFIPQIYESKLTRTVVTFFGNLILSLEVWQVSFGEGIIKQDKRSKVKTLRMEANWCNCKVIWGSVGDDSKSTCDMGGETQYWGGRLPSRVLPWVRA